MAIPVMAPVSVVSVALLAAVVFIYLYQKPRYKLPPGPCPWLVVGNLGQVKPVMFRCFAEWAQKYGPIISVWFGSTLNVIVSNSELAREVLRENDQKLADRHRSRSAAKFSRDGKDLIWANYGPHYVKVRKVCTVELFSGKRLESLRPIREDEVTAMVESIFADCTDPVVLSGKKSLLLRKYIGAVAFNNVTRLAFGKRFVDAEGAIDAQGMEFKAIVENGTKLGASLSIAEHIPWLRWMFLLDEGAFAMHGARRDRLTRAIIEEHVLARQNTGATKQHFLETLLVLKEKYDLSEDTIIGLLWDMVTAGSDTSAVSVEWAMVEVIRHPRIQKKAQDELDSVVGFERVMTESDFPNLPYLQCIVKEALRLHPPTPMMLPHRSNTHVKIGGYDIPKGSNIHVNVWAIARDPALWSNPLEFKPERFLEADIDVKGHDFRLLPFGAGRRMCPGTQLGINLVTSMLGHLLHHFVWNLTPLVKPDEIDMSENPGLVTYMRSPLQAVAIPRLPPELYKRVAADL
ncbi:hypothetical protein MLD38_004515 [Melastoma candidum]|uniref:Uncharacterized protein n=1 Tax=Melastoma candidum TaxID=119954 RepID=A0ACB9S5E7_9MYRT|nr:hypothetical protein MLD38_004515 [Melastoma candidum]